MEACFDGRDADDVYARYFRELRVMIATMEADVVGHFDRILWRGLMCGAQFNLARLQPVIRTAWETLAKRNIALELNTSLLRTRHAWHDDLLRMLTWFREEGGWRVLINSDAHATHELGINIELARDLLEAAGLTPLHMPGFIGRQLLLDQQGLWMDLAHWRSMEDALAAVDAFVNLKGAEAIVEMLDQAILRMYHLEPVYEDTREMTVSAV